MNVSKQEIDRLALESYERLTNGSKDSNTCLFYREGFEAGFQKAQELERFAMQMAKTPVEIKVDKRTFQDALEQWRKLEPIPSANQIKEIVERQARRIEREMFEVMAKEKVAECWVVDDNHAEGSVYVYNQIVVFNEEAAKNESERLRSRYSHYNYKHLLKMSDAEFEHKMIVAETNGCKNTDAVRKWRQTLKEDKA